jgi:predicted DNA-binding antitoxin AbrB/MazE fold protein
MSKVINAVYTNGVFRPLEPVVLPEGEPVQVHVPERPLAPPERLAALEAFDATCEELSEEQWRVFEEAARRRPCSEDASLIYEWLSAGYQHRDRTPQAASRRQAAHPGRRARGSPRATQCGQLL